MDQTRWLRNRLAGALIALAMFCAPDTAPATPPERLGSVTGQVLDSLTGQPLASAVVRVVEVERRGDTHADGRFALTGIPAGTYTLQVQRVGYRPVRRQVTVPAEGATDLIIRMAPTALELPGVVVTGTLRAQESEDAIQPVSVVGGQRLDRRLAATLGELLDKEPGVASVSMGPASSRPVIRGLGGDRVLLLEDGARPGDMSYSSPDHAVTSDPGAAERVEVVRGPAALLYGSNALSGVVNIIREEIPASQPEGTHGRLTLQGESATRGRYAGLEVTTPAGLLALRIEGSARGGSDLRTPAGRLDNTQLATYTAGIGVGLARDWGHTGVAGRTYHSRYGIPGGFVGGHEEGVTIDMRRSNLRGELHRVLEGRFLHDLEGSAGLSHYAHEEIEAGGILGTAFTLVTAEANLMLRHGRAGPFGSGGFGVRGQFRDFAYGGSLRTPDTREWNGAVFFLEEYARGRLRLQVGGRFDATRIGPVVPDADKPPRNFGALSGSAGGLVDLGRGWAAGANLGRAFRTPDVNDLYSDGPHLAAYREEVGNPNLELEQGLGVDAFVRIHRPGLRAELALFRNSIRQFIYARETGDTSQRNLPIAQYTGRDAVLRGGEVRVVVAPAPRFVVEGTGSYVRGTLTDLNLPLPLVPPLRGSLEARYEHASWFAGGGVRLAARQGRIGELEEPTDGYAVADLVAGYRWPWFGRLHALTLRVDNLTDATWRDHLSRLKSIMPGAARSLSVVYRAEF